MTISQVAGFSQSALDPAGEAAQWVANLFWIMVGCATVIWIVVIGLSVYSIFVRPGTHPERRTKLLVIGGGAFFPTLVLTVLVSFAMAKLPDFQRPAPPGSPQYWGPNDKSSATLPLARSSGRSPSRVPAGPRSPSGRARLAPRHAHDRISSLPAKSLLMPAPLPR